MTAGRGWARTASGFPPRGSAALTGPAAFAWIAQDIHPVGGAGDPTRATAEKGRLTAKYQARRFIDLLRDVTRPSLGRLE
jgi:creatinine amidohydrolase